MLALKSMRMPSAVAEHTTTIDRLPPEILDLVAENLYNTGFGQVDTLLPFSVVCHRFRQSALPFLFSTISHIIRDRLDQREIGLLRRLVNHPHLLPHVRTLHILQPPEVIGLVHSLDTADAHRLTLESTWSDLRVLQVSLLLMPGLRRIRVDCSAAAAYQIIKMLPDDHVYEIILDHLYTSSDWPDLLEATTSLASIAGCHRLGLGVFGDLPSQHELATTTFYDTISRASAINLHMSWLLDGSQTGHKGRQDENATCACMLKKPAWSELHLLVRRAPGTHHHSFRDLDLSLIPWINIRRLSILWEYTVPLNQFIHDVAPELTNLQALRLRAAHHRLYHPDCRYDVPATGLFADAPIVPPFRIPFEPMRELRELEIDGICNHIPIKGLVGPKLRRLRLHCEDAQWSVCSAESQRSHNDILFAAKIAPDLEQLELDVGYIQNLWHPTAIPGVDLDMEQYAFLNAICKFGRLRLLRLFPPFVPKDSPRFSRRVLSCLPVSDDQAVRVFEHVRTQCPSLQMLSIAAIPSFVNIDTMCWDVKRQGEKTILTTRHRARNYQHRQVWIGQRRLSSEIKRFSTPRRYIADSECWTLTRNDARHSSR
ncbi:hypothetical protein A1O1_05966 [Capronia coronata CBS 617.96]|uniref:F-box domain-containing protein n=1 Tax=Capronia coronata CBS 617.96 TaxID=1182541 RepID=W9Y7J0_9EURO|nr:uncharacterized protein A1O1_05966 [Capronia coronata CBS 617.96]EXJ85600.1 hypothetical protein A1O1_05966 [Capronia coronata CBS 617.96]